MANNKSQKFRFTGILFDLDGTLIDSREDLADAVNESLKAIGKSELPVEKIIKNVGNGLRQLLSETIGTTDEELIGQAELAFHKFYVENLVTKTKLYPDVLEFLSHYHGKCKFSVVTNKPVLYAEKILKSLFIRDFFDVVVGGGSTQKYKPHPEPILKAAEAFHLTNEDILMVGDGQQDIEGAKAAGISSCLARYGFGTIVEKEAPKADFEINKFDELKEIIL